MKNKNNYLIDDNLKRILLKKELFFLLRKIPFGKLSTYKIMSLELKKRGYDINPRIVGKLLGTNKLIYFYPCHRIIYSNGSLGGFKWPLFIKLLLLKLEGHSFIFKKNNNYKKKSLFIKIKDYNNKLFKEF